MNLRPDMFRINFATRRFISLFITLIWLSIALQPCVMAYVGSAQPQDGGIRHSESHSIDLGGVAHSACHHCKTVRDDRDPCDPNYDKNCDGDETLVYYERSKPVDSEKLFKKLQSFTTINRHDVKTGTYSTPVFTIGKSLQLPAGPPLRDWYRVYLK